MAINGSICRCLTLDCSRRRCLTVECSRGRPAISVQAEFVVDLRDPRDCTGNRFGLTAVKIRVDKTFEVHHMIEGSDGNIVKPERWPLVDPLLDFGADFCILTIGLCVSTACHDGGKHQYRQISGRGHFGLLNVATDIHLGMIRRTEFRPSERPRVTPVTNFGSGCRRLAMKLVYMHADHHRLDQARSERPRAKQYRRQPGYRVLLRDLRPARNRRRPAATSHASFDTCYIVLDK